MDRDWYYASAAALCLLLIFGCSNREERDGPDEPPYPASMTSYAGTPAKGDSVFSFIGEIDQEAIRTAFAGLPRYNFTRYSRTEQFDNQETLIAYEERITRHLGPPSDRSFSTVARDSSGAFDYGYFKPFVSQSSESLDPTDLAGYVIPEDPAYLSARSRDAYTYRSLRDTLMWDVTARVIEIRARPQEGDGQSIRRARLYVEHGTKRLIAIYIERIDRAMWYREESQFYVHIRPAPNGSWVPYNTRFETKIGIPFRPAQRFRTVATYYAYAESM